MDQISVLKRCIFLQLFRHMSFLGAFEKFRKTTITFIMSFCPDGHDEGNSQHETIWLPLDGF